MKPKKSILPFVGCAVILLSASSLNAATIAYIVPAGATSNQTHNGLLGMDFDVIGADGITVTRLGAFDSGQDGILGTVNVGIVDRATGLVVGETASFSGVIGDLVDGSRFITLSTPIFLASGFQGSITAEGYGAEGNGNAGNPNPSATDDGGGSITFVGGARWGGDGPLALAPNVDAGPVNRYLAGTFVFESEDTDNDGMPDAWEEKFGLNPNDPSDRDEDTLDMWEGEVDPRPDGLTNLEEFENGTDPTKGDTDGDGLGDGDEVDGAGDRDPTDPTRADSDRDGLTDKVETNTGIFVDEDDTGTDPNLQDSDDDSYGDLQEVLAKTDPNDPAPPHPALNFEGMLAIDYLGGVGTQAFSEGLGHDFIVHGPDSIFVTALGVFDSGADGLNLQISSELWLRDDAGTPGNFADDSGTLLISELFTLGDPGFLLRSNRIKPLPEPLELEPGAYTIIGRGYGAAEMNGNTGGPGDDLKPVNDGGGLIEFVGGARWGGGPVGADGFPTNADGGPPVRYAAGTFAYLAEPPKLFQLVVSASGDDLVLKWDSQAGKVYDILWTTDPVANPDPKAWPIYPDPGAVDIETTPDTNFATIPRPPDELALFVVLERDIPPVYSENFANGEGGWTASAGPGDSGNTTWDFGPTPAVPVFGPDSGPPSADNFWSTNTNAEYGNESVILLTSPPIDLGTPGTVATLFFDFWDDLDAASDNCTVRIRDAGDNSQIGADILLDAFGLSWQTHDEDITGALGSRIIIECEFVSDGDGTVFYGIALGNFRIEVE